ncbi:MAG: thermonuclease family protein [Nanoarchaeota archaeon]
MAEKKERGNGGNNQGVFALLIILLFFLALIDISAILLLRPSFSSTQQNKQPDQKEVEKVIEVIDGETFILDNGDVVKLIGIDAPEPGGKYYEESKRFIEFLIINKSVTLEKDLEDKDSSGRLLRYAYVDYNGRQLFVNYESARQGYSLPFHASSNVKYRLVIEQARTECINEQLNLCGSI